jgi:hypothetical protein
MCFLKRRNFHFSLGTFTFINFLVMLAALILSLVMIISGSKQLHDADNNWYGKAGDSLWCAIGAVVSLLIATLFFGGGGFCHRKSNKKVDTVVTETKVQVAPVPYPHDTKQQYVTSATSIPHDQYQPDIKYAQQMPQGQTQTYDVAHPSYPELPTTEPYTDGTKHVYVSGQTGQIVDPYTGSPIVYPDQTVQRTVETQSPLLNATTATSQGQVPNATDTTNTATTNVTRNMSASEDKTVYIPTEQGPVPVNPNAVSGNLQTVDSSGNPIVKP